MSTESVSIDADVAAMSKAQAVVEYARICASDDEAEHLSDRYDHVCRRLRAGYHARGAGGWQDEAAARLARLQALRVANGGGLGNRIAKRHQALWDGATHYA